MNWLPIVLVVWTLVSCLVAIAFGRWIGTREGVDYNE